MTLKTQCALFFFKAIADVMPDLLCLMAASRTSRVPSVAMASPSSLAAQRVVGSKPRMHSSA